MCHSVMVQPALGVSTSHVGVLVQVLDTVLLIQLPTNTLWEAVNDSSPDCVLVTVYKMEF